MSAVPASAANGSGSVFRDHPRLMLFCALASLALTAWGAWADNVINFDGVQYLRAAQYLADGAYRDALLVFKWPFYSALIALTSTLTRLPLEVSAHVLNATLHTILVLAFLAALREVGADRRLLWIGAVVILCFPTLNGERPQVIRDPGYLAFFMLATVYLLRYTLRRASRGNLFAWAAAMGTATLFRIEGLVFLLLVPILIAYRRCRTLGARVGVLAMGFGALGLLVAGFLWWAFHPPDGGTHLGALRDPLTIVRETTRDIAQGISDRLVAIEIEFLERFSDRYAYAVLVLTAATIVFWEIVRLLNPLFAVLIGHALWRRLVFPRRGAATVWMWLIAINAAILYAFTIANMFLADRYPLALTLTLMLAVPFSLAFIWDRWQARRAEGWRYRWTVPLVGFLFLVSTVSGMEFPTSKHYIRDAAEWIDANTPRDATLLTTDIVISHYARRESQTNWINISWGRLSNIVRRDHWQQYDYIAVRFSRREGHRAERLIEMLEREPVRAFENRRGDRVLVFDTRDVQ